MYKTCWMSNVCERHVGGLMCVKDMLEAEHFPCSQTVILSRSQGLLLIPQYYCLAVARGFQNFPLEGTWGSRP